ncbi:hypothetical protein ACVNS2_18010 [Paenibacillus caseinilyticus]|uniref:Phosphoribosylglycinamide formyltransferase n=1 Tax=Paenibacillus mucilaginosus K02 TaxID=997761 RepID=R9UN62_9BACL|nr:hypothetical protein [Paenibacillus mucilaginosus]AGN70698.1 hypothetical protein B2K_39440 [Paenibacillus mucilaginosus K02]
MLAESEPEMYFIPPYVGRLGWIGMRLDGGADWEAIAGVITDAYLCRAPKKYIESIAFQEMIPKYKYSYE